MTQNENTQKTHSAEREERAAAALRENLRKRKKQQQERLQDKPKTGDCGKCR